VKIAQDIILRPIITEKSMDMLNAKKYVFEVAKDSNKPEIAAAVETLFGVKVKTVHTINMKRKPKRVGYHSGYTSEWKKAIVTLTESSKTIEFFDGMN
jgi:large subunit ribosomal protein L23